MGNKPGKEAPPSFPIDTTFKLPSPLPSWPSGEGFAKGKMELGGIEVYQVTTFTRVWRSQEGGQDNQGASFFTPAQIPEGFSILGSYAQPNNKPLFGKVLVAKETKNDDDDGEDGTAALRSPLDYSLVWTSESLNIKQDGHGYIWLPVSPEGYKAVGLIVTASPEKPDLDAVRCVREDLTDQCENGGSLWDNNGFSVYELRPSNRGVEAIGVHVGTFGTSLTSSLACLKNKASNLSSMPNNNQIQTLIQAYSPWVYFHGDEPFFPSSTSWFFSNGALLYQKGNNSPTPTNPTGSNLPQGGSNDGNYWLDLPVDETEKEKVKKGDLSTSKTYIHIKPMLGGTVTDIAVWIFYPFNGAAKLKVKFINIGLGKIGEHVGDWEHITLRVSNFNGELWRVYYSEHSSGTWRDASEVEFEEGNKVVTYSSLHGHAMYAHAGTVLQGNVKLGIGIRNDCEKGKERMDCGERFEVVVSPETVKEPGWLNYMREWGPKISYDIAEELKKIEKVLPGKLKKEVEKVVESLPAELLGEEGPTGPKVKDSWRFDEK
ncbi:Vacuolar protein sorting-associated protein 62 [Dioscorea alata]|uniref:Vacuolar protein sorting-associated protein 62 n=1 Tax=Dioscorea alata TaxID=55571 RepID=A0ACB7VMW2_DIOAL|nr:Vacuolar protein sorting-associated protein 62 [Dioscorea alata]